MRINKSFLNYSRVIHVYVSMALLTLMVFFSITGVTLNHPEWFADNEAYVDELELQLPRSLLGVEHQGELIKYLHQQSWFNGKRLTLERDEYELFISDKGPGAHLAITVDLESGDAFIEKTNYGMWAKLNDLHKGRNSGAVWRLVIDVSAILMILFSVTGLVLALAQRRVNKTLALSLVTTLGVFFCYLFYV
ncbi:MULTISPECIES: PepSY-associated TM helix domain-containing protein [Pseudoalteromonas]|uniref:Peptidase n=1 Tax=Pseudoalteromonas aurantia 208 TaxID=1314867 RepID=A0ABR9ECM2_9GAMM|nr:PepSY-associated TM helix domain-containing protein [Pseudoalteromonas aurantia]MBE0368736.1 hypothetical protein [Pseudoalteromonas aurantia 208]MBQ4847980.1 PepSY-associated TM helix domain-containing protein [Pseudoalteromonas sp. MMG005]